VNALQKLKTLTQKRQGTKVYYIFYTKNSRSEAGENGEFA
jgi:hypothetical protein